MSNGRQIGSIVGSLIAAYFTAGTSYAAFAVAAGGAVGGAIGGSLDPEKVVGPRLEDLKVQYSSYGAGVPYLKGTERFGGNVIWSTDKREVATTERQGKGGGVESTSYAYFVNMRVMLCETPTDGATVNLVKIFKDGKLIWDASSGIPVGSALASEESPDASFILYQGHQSQLPNAEEEAFHGGPGSVSAYRGVVSIYMRNINTPSGRVPQFSFVLSNTSSTGAEKIYYGKAVGNTNSRAVIVNGEITQIQNAPLSDSQAIRVTPIVRQASVSPPAWMASTLPGDVHWPIVAVSQAESMQGIHPVASSPGLGAGFAYTVYDFNSKIETVLATGSITDPWAELVPEYAVKDPLGGGYMLKAPAKAILLPSTNVVTLPGTERGAGYYNGLIYCVDFTASKMKLVAIDASGVIQSSWENQTTMTVAPRCRVLAASDGGFYVVGVQRGSPGAPRPVWKVSANGWEMLCADTGVEAFSPGYVEAFCTDTYALIGPSSDNAGVDEVSYQMVRFNVVTTTEVKAKDIIADQCERVGELRYDVSALPDSDTLDGYKIAIPANARANIEPILTAFGYFPVDEDGLIKFKRYADITSLATVSYDELGQAEGGGAAETMPLTRMQEIDLPRSVTVSYIDASHDFQTASEKDVRHITDATEDQQIQLAVCTNSDRAKRVAQTVLYDAWRKQNARHTTVSRKYAFISPGDGVTIEYPRGTFKLWMVLSTNDTGVLVEWSVAPGDAAIFTQTAIGAAGYTGQEVTPLAAALIEQILDIPMLRDSDNNAGPYVALDSSDSVPANGELYVGEDDTTLVSRGTVSASAPIGFADTTLADWTLTGLIDEKNLVTVNLGDDTFNSVTRDVLLAGGGEYWAYGQPGRWEIGASAQAVSLGGGLFTLSRHLRGLFGTERNTGNHAYGDVFVLLRSVGMLRPDTGVAGIGQIKSYRPVAKGRSVNSVPSERFANTGESLMPLSPINARRSDTNSISVDRRSRFAINNATGALPLGEAVEAWTWAFYNSSFTTLLATILTSTATVTAAQMTSAGITPTATLYIRVRQVSDSVGPGHELQATL